MKTYRKILVPIHFLFSDDDRIDAAPDSRAAMTQAVNLAKRIGSTLVFTHVFAGWADAGASSDDGELPGIHVFLDGLVDEVRAHGVEARWLFLFGHPWEEIASLAASEGFDLVILGTRQRPGQGRAIGSTAAAVMAHATVPVWVAKGRRASGGRVIVATDFSAICGEVLRHGTSLAKWLGSELHVVHACRGAAPSDPNAAAEDLRRCRAKMEIGMADVDHDIPVPSYTSHVEIGTPENVIWRIAREVDAHLVLVGFHDRSLVERMLRGNTAENLLAELPCSLMSVSRSASARKA